MLLEYHLCCVFQFLLIYKCKKKRIKGSQEVILTNLGLLRVFCKYLARIIQSSKSVESANSKIILYANEDPYILIIYGYSGVSQFF